MPKMTLPIGGGFYQSESLPISAQRLINWYPVVPQTANANTQTSLFHTPGQKQFSVLSGINRGQEKMGGLAFAVNGNNLYQVNENKTFSSIGIITGTGNVSMATNGTILVIVVPGGNSYVYDGANLTQITDPDFRIADTVSFKDGFFVFTASNGKTFFISTLNQPLVFLALDFGTSEINPDPIIATHVTHNELFVINEETIELFQNIGGSGFPFQRIPGANIQKGSHATFGIVGLDETFAFVGGGKDEKSAIYQVADSQRANKISTAAIDNAIQEFTREEISNCIAMTYFDRGSQIAIFTFESQRIPSVTFAYNATTSRITGIPIWFEFQTGVEDNRWNVNSILLVYGKILAGRTDGNIVELDHNTFTDLGETILRQLTTGALSNQYEPVFVPEIALWLESGVGNSGQGLDPIVSMDYSDNGKTFSNRRTRKIGKVGVFGQQTVWRRNGRVPVQRFHRFTITDPVKPVIRNLQAIAQASGPAV